MMSVNSIGKAATTTQLAGATPSMPNDSVSKSIQNQIANAQKQLQEIGADKNMTPEDKAKRRQEIQQEIANLNQQLQQRQIQKRRDQQAQRAAERANSKNSQKEPGDRDKVGISSAGMRAMLSADTSLKQAKVQGNVASKMEGKANVLKIEIKQDKGQDTSAKEAELAETTQKAQSAQAAQMTTLAEANHTLAEANRTASKNSQTTKAAEASTETALETTGTEENTSKASADKTAPTGQTDAPGNPNGEKHTEKADNAPEENTPASSHSIAQRHVDIRL